MKAKFVTSPAIAAKVQREMLASYPRALRKALRITTPTPQNPKTPKPPHNFCQIVII